MKAFLFFVGILWILTEHVRADPQWPSDIDELEEIMFQLTSFRARKFADNISPCINQASGPGRQNAAEWLRTGFHDMSTANTYFGTGGLDGSLQYELDNGENTGPGHRSTLEFMAPYVTKKSSLADLIALGVHLSVRSCGGPDVPFRAGRKDALHKGNIGVPQPQNSVGTFKLQFDRMGFSPEEMIQMVACGHSLGGVHTAEFPDLVPNGTAKHGEASFDSTVAAFDKKVVMDYLSGNTTDPLVLGPSVSLGKNSDFKIFDSDGNTTMQHLADDAVYFDTCKVVFQKMIEVVPPYVWLTDPIKPYMIKPVDLQLTLVDGGSTLHFTGYIRVRTTQLSGKDMPKMAITYKNRLGNSGCGPVSCAITTTVQGISRGFDDTFAFFSIDESIPSVTGISSFIVTLFYANGTQDTFDNHGNGYPVQDAILFQQPQSCVLSQSGDFAIVAAVRNDRLKHGAAALISYKVPQDTSPVPLLQNDTVSLRKGLCAGSYTLFAANYTIQGGFASEAKVDLINGDKVDSFKSVRDAGGRCLSFQKPVACVGVRGGLGNDSSTTA